MAGSWLGVWSGVVILAGSGCSAEMVNMSTLVLCMTCAGFQEEGREGLGSRTPYIRYPLPCNKLPQSLVSENNKQLSQYLQVSNLEVTYLGASGSKYLMKLQFKCQLGLYLFQDSTEVEESTSKFTAVFDRLQFLTGHWSQGQSSSPCHVSRSARGSLLPSAV